MFQKLKSYQIVGGNLLFGLLMGGVFGYVTQHFLAWLAGGSAVGLLLGGAAQWLFQGLQLSPRGSLRGLLVVMSLETAMILCVVAPGVAADASLHPVRLPVLVSPQDLGMAYEPVSLTTEDGVTIKGWYIPGSNRAAVIAVHGLDGNRTQVIYHAETLHQAGFGVLALDMRAQGESGGAVFDWLCYEDTLAGLRYLQSRTEVDPAKIGGLGLSAGGHSIIYAAAYNENLRAIWSDGAGMGDTRDGLEPMLPSLRPYFYATPFNWMYYRFMDWMSGDPPSPAFRDVLPSIAPRHVMFIGAGRDPIEAEAAERYASLAGPNAAVWIIPDAAHVGGIFSAPVEYKQRMVDFFKHALLEPAIEDFGS